MQPTDDSVLLRQFAENLSDEAFAALVNRHINLVYSVALRQVGNPHNAEEIAQAVFVILAKKAAQLRHEKALSSWLFQTARLTANNFIRSELRRRHREQEACMQTTLDEPEPELWQKIAPLLDNAVAALREKDRRAVLLRFYERRNLREVGAALGASEDAAEKRVNRALGKLRKFFSRRGVDSTAAAIAENISAHSVQAAPVALAKSVTAVAIAKGAAASGSTLTLIKGALKIMAWTKMKTTIVASAIILLAAGTVTTLVVQHQHQTRLQPRTSWVFAGYANPQSALMSYLWASVCQSDQKTFENSLTPSQKLVYEQMISMNMKVPQPHSEAETVADTFKRANDQWQGGSYRIIDKKSISENEVLFHVFAQMSNGAMEVNLKMSKIGNEWKFDGIQNRKIITRN